MYVFVIKINHPFDFYLQEQLEGTDLEAWSSHIESLRKDVECTFGILKKRFMFLKFPIRLHTPEAIEKVFRTCCLLHNWLLEYDGRDDWEKLLLEEEVEVESEIFEEMGIYQASQSRHATNTEGCYTRTQFRSANQQAYDEVTNQDSDYTPMVSDVEAFKTRRKMLIEHYVIGIQRKMFNFGLK